MDIAGKSVAILGAGESGIAAARLCLSKGGKVFLYDEKTSEIPNDLKGSISYFPEFQGIEKKLKKIPDISVVSPGIPPHSEFLKFFLPHSPVISEIEFASKFYPGEIIAITGTNGKTTVCHALNSTFQRFGIPSQLAGNSHQPFSKVILSNKSISPLFLEVSSFQLGMCSHFSPKVAILTNFSPDHLDYHASLENYYHSKMCIFSNQSPEDLAILPFGFLKKNISLAVRKIFFSTNAETDYCMQDGFLKAYGEKFFPLNSRLEEKMGVLENILPFSIVCREILLLSADQILEEIENFVSLSHRYEIVREFEGVHYINDSKSTNISSLQKALEKQKKKVILICGGKDKGLDYSSLMPLFKKKVSYLVCVGENAFLLKEIFSEHVPSFISQDLSKSISLAKSFSQEGDRVLFSPGTSSLDNFLNFEERGNRFREIVNTLL